MVIGLTMVGMLTHEISRKAPYDQFRESAYVSQHVSQKLLLILSKPISYLIGDRGYRLHIMTSWNALCITGPLWRESKYIRWIPLTKWSEMSSFDIIVVTLNKFLKQFSCRSVSKQGNWSTYTFLYMHRYESDGGSCTPLWWDIIGFKNFDCFLRTSIRHMKIDYRPCGVNISNGYFTNEIHTHLFI